MSQQNVQMYTVDHILQQNQLDRLLLPKRVTFFASLSRLYFSSLFLVNLIFSRTKQYIMLNDTQW